MKNKKETILLFSNLLIPIILFIILLFSKLSDNTMYFMIMSIMIGWLIPYIVLLITGLSLISIKHPKITMIFNFVNILLCIMLLALIISIYDKKFLVFIIEYSIIMLTSIINVIFLFIYLKKHPVIDTEKEEIKRIKKENNGAIV